MIMKINDYVMKNAIRGACTCGKCVDVPDNPEEHQPDGHTADLCFFKVAKKDTAKKEELLALVNEECPEFLDGKEHSYIEIGAKVGDQGLGMMLMGLGDLLGIWKLLTPYTAAPFLPDDLKKQMVGMGYISIQKEVEVKL